MKILAIETSCDETAAAVIETNNRQLTNDDKKLLGVGDCKPEVKILSNTVTSQIPIHKKYGGVFPEMASRAHTEKIIDVVEKSLEVAGLSPNDIDLIAVTIGPGLIGSLLIGVNFAKTLAYAKNKPIVGINHLAGHIYSNFSEGLPQFPAIILIVSGGHTGLYFMKSHRDIRALGETLDDAAGEAFDKVAKLLNLGYPGGPAISKAAAEIRNKSQIPNIKNYKLKINLPRPMLNSRDYNFSFSGLKTAVLYKIKELSKISALSSKIPAAIAAEFQEAVIDILIGKTIKAAYEFRPKSICLCGGVSANRELRLQMAKSIADYNSQSSALSSKFSVLSSPISFHVPPLSLTTDNAAMIGLAAAYNLDEATDWKSINADANLKL